MPVITMREMLEAGVHFGHQTRRWNPKMKPYIYGSRNGIHIIDLQKTIKLFRDAYKFVSDTVGTGNKVLFIGTKKQARDIVSTEAQRAGMFSVTGRWLGGTLTNFKTIKASLERLRALDKMSLDGTFAKLTKKEVAKLDLERGKLMKNLGGIKDIAKLPGAIFIIDPGKEYNAAREAARMKIPIVAVADTNCNPDGIDYVIPGNDDAIRAIQLFTQRIADACLEGAKRHEEVAAQRGREGEGEAKERRGGREREKERAGDAPAPRVDRVARTARKPEGEAAAGPTSASGEAGGRPGGNDAQ